MSDDLAKFEPMPDDVVDMVAKEVAALVRDHIEAMYPAAAKAVAWRSASLSIQGVVRNAMAAAGKAAERGYFEDWLKRSQRSRKHIKRLRKRARGEQ